MIMDIRGDRGDMYKDVNERDTARGPRSSPPSRHRHRSPKVAGTHVSVFVDIVPDESRVDPSVDRSTSRGSAH